MSLVSSVTGLLSDAFTPQFYTKRGADSASTRLRWFKGQLERPVSDGACQTLQSGP